MYTQVRISLSLFPALVSLIKGNKFIFQTMTPAMVDNTTSWNLTKDTSGTGHRPSSKSPSRQMNTKEIVEIVCFGVLAVLIVFANSLMIGAFHVNRRLRTRTN